MVGDALDVVVGIGKDQVFFAAGRHAVETLKKMIEQSKSAEGKDVLPMRVSLAAAAIAKFAEKLSAKEADNGDTEAGDAVATPKLKAMTKPLLAALAKAGDKDHLLVTANPIEQGVRFRVEMEADLLKVLLQATMGMLGGGMPGGPSPTPPPYAPFLAAETALCVPSKKTILAATGRLSPQGRQKGSLCPILSRFAAM